MKQMIEKQGQGIITESKLRSVYDRPSDLAVAKQLNRLDTYCRHFIKLSPFVLLATTDHQGRIDVSPRGDAPGFVHAVDDRTLHLPDRRGNNRLDSLTNIVQTSNVGLLFMIPGFMECLRVNGAAQIRQDSSLIARAEVQGKKPTSVILISVQEAFFQCGKALARSRLWDPHTQVDRNVMPGLGRILKEQTSEQPVSHSQGDADDDLINEAYRNQLY
ncbi:MAG TPA: pyridoxamine 5'-phosphate oxidase family protein [Alphaproteobacteria bacterium]|nr:pyridoxamine 5'-phosphate oxidase family protein [Alphaproteobacteria bacterium]